MANELPQKQTGFMAGFQQYIVFYIFCVHPFMQANALAMNRVTAIYLLCVSDFLEPDYRMEDA